MCNIAFEVPRVSTFVFKKSSEKKYSPLYLWLRDLRVLVGILLAQRRRQWPNLISQLGQCVLLSGVAVSDYPPVQVTPGGNLKLVSSYPL